MEEQVVNEVTETTESNVIVVNNNSNLTLQDEVVKSTKNVYCSVKGNTVEEKKLVFNAMSQCDYKVADKLGETIALKDVILQKYNKVNETTGELEGKYRTILIDSQGVTYASASVGLFNSLMRLFAIIGEPNTWASPINIQVVETAMKKGGKTYTIKTV